MRWRSYNKYKNKKNIYDGIKFDSEQERNHYIYLKFLEQQGDIHDLKRQVRFELQPSFKHHGKTIRAITYVADFTFYDLDGNYHIIDVKGFKTDVYLLKKKMMQFKGYDIEEV